MILNEKIANLAKLAISDESQFLLDVVISSNHGPKKVTVILDGDHGITIEDCASVSRGLLKAIEEEGILNEGFTLEVTTPGLDQPLKVKRQYTKNIGRSLRILLKDKRVENGKLVEVTEQAISLENEIRERNKRELRKTVYPFLEIEKATVQISFK